MIPITFYDRFTMGFSLGVHIILATIGIALPAIIAVAEFLYLKYKDKYYDILASRLTIVLAVLFAVGTASGTLVAVNLLVLWPKFMQLIGTVAILPFFTEVFAFFGEAILLGVYLYSRHKIRSGYIRLAIIIAIGFFAALSGVLITMINAFMNTPVGFNIPTYLSTGIITGVNPLAVFDTPSTGIEVFHVISTSYLAGTSIFFAYFALMLLRSMDNERKRNYYKKAVKLTFAIILVAVILSIISGLLSIPMLLHLQPEKYAAVELNLISGSHAPEVLFGFYSSATNSIVDGISVPNLQSILANGTASTVVPGLNQFPKSTWPPLFIHDLFDIMVLIGFGLGFFCLVILILAFLKKKVFENRIALWLYAVFSAFVLILLESGWVVDEVGRQPWIVYNIMTVQQAANQSASIIPLAIGVIIVYIVILPATIYALKKIFDGRPLEKDLGDQ
ncbi:MAG: cytochrome ubiquinol oxidase subunit I [Candidatus Micrarchaeaceae archaeon]